MENYSGKEYIAALQVVSSTINNCEKMQSKFVEGTSQLSLLKNRIKALYISKYLIEDDPAISNYSKDDLMEALRPVASIISKCEKAQSKFEEGTRHYNRFQDLISAMYISKSLITDEICRRG